MFRAVLLQTGLLLAWSAPADTIIFRDGSFVEGEITRQTSRTIHVKTRFGARSYDRRDIDEIIEDTGSFDPEAVHKFDELPAAVKAVLNARAEYDLGQYEDALKRLEAYRDYRGNKAIRIRIDWLIIEINERLGNWDAARRLLNGKKKDGTPREKIRAEAHLAIFEANSGYDLRYVGHKHARNFIKDKELRNRARQPGILKEYEFMRIALEEASEQLLVEDEMSVKTFADKLDTEATYQACEELPRSGDVARHLPYIDGLRRAEATLAKARSILPDYGSAFELDLVRTELSHLLPILERLSEDASALSPETYIPPFERRTGRLTKEGRARWRRRCDEFLTAAVPVTRLLEYMTDKVNNYPKTMRDLRKLLLDWSKRHQQAVKAVRRARNRTHV